MNRLTFFPIVLLACSNVESDKLGETREGLPDAESWNATITLTNNGSRRAIIKSGHLEKYQQRQYILLDQNVDADFFNENEIYTSNLKSEIAEIDESKDFLIAMGNVVVVSDSGVTLYTDTLSWDNVDEKVFTDDSVVFITEQNDTLYGIGFKSDIELNNWEIMQPTGVFHEDQLSNSHKKLKAEKLCKRYGDFWAVREVDLEVNKGEIVGLLGPNGAGKTTTFYMIKPTDGSIYLDGMNITRKAMYQRSRFGIGYLPQDESIFRKLSVEDNLRLVLEMSNFTKEDQKNKIDQLLNDLSIEHIRNSNGGNLSGGERRRVEIARTLAMDPDFILLDEPFAGVDPIAVEDIQSIVSSLKQKNIGVLITDHNVRETLSITDRSYLLFDGNILKSGSSEFLANDDEARRLYLGESFSL